MDREGIPAGIRADEVIISPTAEIADDVEICAIDGARARRVIIGDYVRIASGVRAFVPELEIGDWCMIHGPTKIYGYESCMIGACTWIAQDVILNSTDLLTIGRGATISARASIWTHFTGGDTVQGCRYNDRKPAFLGDDVWIGVGATLAPIIAGEKSMALANASVTRDMLPNHVYGGVPAVDLTDKLGPPYKEISDEEKLARLKRLFAEFKAQALQSGEKLDFDRIQLACGAAVEDSSVSIFDAASRTYSKLGTPEEVAFMKFLLPCVKFFPHTPGRDT
ncbi:hypothetical protein J7K50_08415 [bacterium]|nr:hypothetical protein [bacterium]